MISNPLNSGGSSSGRRQDGFSGVNVHDGRDEAQTQLENVQLNETNTESKWTKMVITDSNGTPEGWMSPMKIATVSSWTVNWMLLIVKIAVVILSSSKAVLAAMVDSAVDLVSQAVLSLATQYMQKHSPNYPVGRSRLEALSVLACASIMIMASIEVIQFSVVDIYNGVNGEKPELDVGIDMYTILSIGIFFKVFLFAYCRFVNRTQKNDMLEALAEDHFNDVISNSAAMVTAAIAFNTIAWWVDPAGAILISVVIIYRWISIMSEQVKKIVGHTAPQEFIDQVEDIARVHDSRLSVDVTRAYHFGARYNVEMEIVLPGSMTVMESHDIALALQHKIEELADVERAFVHVDHQERDGLEHKVERELVKGSGASAGTGSGSGRGQDAGSSGNQWADPNQTSSSELRSRSSRSEPGAAV